MNDMVTPKTTAILVVDDEADLREAIAFDLKKQGYPVFTAGNGREAFEIVKNQTISVILSDVRMPGGDGLELLEKVRENFPDGPIVILISGFADISIEEAYHKGAQAVFPKPFDRKALLKRVAQATSPKGEMWKNREERLHVDFTVSTDLSEDVLLSSAAQAHNLGRGGMFLALGGKLPSEGSDVRFSVNLQFPDGTVSSIKGTAIVRWIRRETTESGPRGIGVEFQTLEPQCRKLLVEFINEHKTRSFIPRG